MSEATDRSSDYVLVASPYTYEADERETPLVRAPADHLGTFFAVFPK